MLTCHSILAVIVAASLSTIANGAAPTGEKAARPNIVLCMADDQGWGDVAYNGHSVLKTPNH